jgi:hypothetical protein
MLCSSGDSCLLEVFRGGQVSRVPEFLLPWAHSCAVAMRATRFEACDRGEWAVRWLAVGTGFAQASPAARRMEDRNECYP